MQTPSEGRKSFHYSIKIIYTLFFITDTTEAEKSKGYKNVYNCHDINLRDTLVIFY